MVGPDTTWTRARFSPEVFSHHQQVAGFSRMSMHVQRIVRIGRQIQLVDHRHFRQRGRFHGHRFGVTRAAGVLHDLGHQRRQRLHAVGQHQRILLRPTDLRRDEHRPDGAGRPGERRRSCPRSVLPAPSVRAPPATRRTRRGSSASPADLLGRQTQRQQHRPVRRVDTSTGGPPGSPRRRRRSSAPPRPTRSVPGGGRSRSGVPSITVTVTPPTATAAAPGRTAGDGVAHQPRRRGRTLGRELRRCTRDADQRPVRQVGDLACP